MQEFVYCYLMFYVDIILITNMPKSFDSTEISVRLFWFLMFGILKAISP